MHVRQATRACGFQPWTVSRHWQAICHHRQLGLRVHRSSPWYARKRFRHYRKISVSQNIFVAYTTWTRGVLCYKIILFETIVLIFWKKNANSWKFQIHFSFVYNLCIVNSAKIGYARCENKATLYLTRLHYLCIVNSAKIGCAHCEKQSTLFFSLACTIFAL